jgi:tape measure domain-containing protein
MSTINQTISLQDKMSSTFKKIYNAASDNIKAFENLHKQVKQVDNSMASAKSSSTSFLNSLLGFSAVQKVFNMITSQIDSAITRFDTLNNYKTIMTNLGMSAEDAESSITTLKNGLDGLPTTLQDSVTSVQRFVAANKNLQASTKMYLALNDAIVAGAASESVQASALEQVTQAYTKGAFEANEWKAMQQAMPAQLDSIAKKLGYTSTAVSGDLYTALQKGKLSMNNFMKAVVELDEEGIDGMANFHDQALSATNGVGTAFTNMKTAITKGLTDAIGKINEGLENAGLGSIQQIISNTGKALQQWVTNIGTGISNVLSMMSPVINFIGQAGQFIKNNWGVIAPILLGVATAIAVIKGAQTGWNIVLGISKALEEADTFILGIRVAALNMQEGATFAATAAQYGFNAALLACPLTWIIIAIIAIIAAIYAVVAIINKVTGSTISATGIIMGILYSLAAFVYNSVIVPIWNALAMLVNFLANCFKDPIASIKILFIDLANFAVQILDNIASAIDAIFGSNLSATVSGWGNSLSSVKDQIKAESGYTEVMKTLSNWDYKSAATSGYSTGSKFSSTLSNSINNSSASSLLDSLNTDTGNLSNSVGTDSTGSKAVKTTTNDDLLSDEDIQLLLDVATRDYKLSYQQVTPNITLTFGDVRETADVDEVLDKVADKLEEIYDGSLEVS